MDPRGGAMFSLTKGGLGIFFTREVYATLIEERVVEVGNSDRLV